MLVLDTFNIVCLVISFLFGVFSAYSYGKSRGIIQTTTAYDKVVAKYAAELDKFTSGGIVSTGPPPPVYPDADPSSPNFGKRSEKKDQ